MKKMGKKTLKMPKDLVVKITDVVFPRGLYIRKEYAADSDTPHVSLAELDWAVKDLGMKKSPGPDYVPAEYMKAIYEVDPLRLRRILNGMLIWEEIPDFWNVARLVLLKKEGRVRADPSGYRPICLMNALSKVFEKIIIERMWQHVNETGCLSDFREVHGSSNKKSDKHHRGGGYRDVRTRKIPVVVCLDVSNAFNSLRWSDIFESLEKKLSDVYNTTYPGICPRKESYNGNG